MSPRPPARAPTAGGRPPPARPTPPLTPISQSAAWVNAQALHGAALMPREATAEAFDKTAEAYWRAGQVEHTFTTANLSLLRMAQAEEHHIALQQALAAVRQDVGGLAEQLARLQATLTALGRVSAGLRREVATATGEVMELLGGLADVLDDTNGAPRVAADGEDHTLDDAPAEAPDRGLFEVEPSAHLRGARTGAGRALAGGAAATAEVRGGLRGLPGGAASAEDELEEELVDVDGEDTDVVEER